MHTCETLVCWCDGLGKKESSMRNTAMSREADPHGIASAPTVQAPMPAHSRAVVAEREATWHENEKLRQIVAAAQEAKAQSAVASAQAKDHSMEKPGPGLKYDAGKLRLDLIPPKALVAIRLAATPARLEYNRAMISTDTVIAQLALWKSAGDGIALAAVATNLMHLIDPQDCIFTPGALKAVAKVLMFGAKKYGEWNWERVENGRERYYAAAMRHILYFAGGELLDPESGIHHLAHALCCVLFLLHMEP